MEVKLKKFYIKKPQIKVARKSFITLEKTIELKAVQAGVAALAGNVVTGIFGTATWSEIS